jgi:hypothetical protein
VNPVDRRHSGAGKVVEIVVEADPKVFAVPTHKHVTSLGADRKGVRGQMRFHYSPNPGLALLLQHFQHVGMITPAGIEPRRRVREPSFFLLAILEYLLDDPLGPGGAGLEWIRDNDVALDKAALGQEVFPNHGVRQVVSQDPGRSE